MKLQVIAVVLVVLALTCDGCEYHRRLEAARKKQEAELRALQERLRQRGLEHAREGAYEEVRRSYTPSEDVSDSHHHGSSSHRTSGIRRVVPSSGGSRYTTIRRVVPSTGGSRYTTTRRVVPVQGSLSHGSNPQVYPVPARVSSLPAGSKFCPGSSTYYCDIEQQCIYNSGIWTCRSESTHSVSRYPVQRGESYTRTRTRYNPYHEQTFGPTHRTYTRYTCSSGMTRVNTSATTFRCQDIDECDTEANDCEQTCKNTYGSFYCQCERGYKREGRNQCIDRDECEDIDDICGAAADCENTEGSYECNCLEGYAKQDGGYCADINECEEANPCDEDKICFNKWGSHECDLPKECPDGYFRPEGTEIENQVCHREAESDDPNSPDTISYKKLLVEARKYPDPSKSLGSMTFSSTNRDYDHSFNIRILEGGENFWFRRKHLPAQRRYGTRYSTARESSIAIDFYNRKGLEPNVPLPFVLMITDTMTPRNHRYSYGYGTSSRYGYQDNRRRIITTRRKADMEIYPMVHGSVDEN